MLPSDKLTIIIPRSGTLIDDFFSEMVKLSQEKSEDVYGAFNNVFYVVRNGETVPRFGFNMVPITEYPTVEELEKRSERRRKQWG